MAAAAAGWPADVDARFREERTELRELGPPAMRLLPRRGPGAASWALHLSSGNGYPIEFLIDEGARRVEVTWSKPDEPVSNLDTLLLGPAMRCVLELRAVTCLHAGVVGVGGRAVAIAGAKGAGKSTLTATLARAGHPILADDLAVLDERPDGFWVQPGPPRLCLWPDTLAAGGEDPDAWPRAMTPTEKRWRALTADEEASGWRHETRARPLAAIWLLAEGDSMAAAPEVQPLRAAEALVRLLEHARAPYLTGPPEPELLARLGRLVSGVRVFEVRRPRGFDTLPALVDTIVGAAATPS